MLPEDVCSNYARFSWGRMWVCVHDCVQLSLLNGAHLFLESVRLVALVAHVRSDTCNETFALFCILTPNWFLFWFHGVKIFGFVGYVAGFFGHLGREEAFPWVFFYFSRSEMHSFPTQSLPRISRIFSGGLRRDLSICTSLNVTNTADGTEIPGVL